MTVASPGLQIPAQDFGLQLDSLADVISFGIAPSVLALVWGLSAVDHRLAWIAAFTFTICGAMRLARFNVQAGNLKHFVGLPIPAGGGAIAAIVHFFSDPIQNPVGSNLMVAAVFFLAFLMISTIRYSSLKHLTLGKEVSSYHPGNRIAGCADSFSFKANTSCSCGCLCDSGPVARIYGILRRKKPGDEMTLADSMQHH